MGPMRTIWFVSPLIFTAMFAASGPAAAQVAVNPPPLQVVTPSRAATVQLTMLNSTGQPVDVYATDQNGQPAYVQSLPAGQSGILPSNPGQTLIFGINRQPFMQYQLTSVPAQQIVLVLPGEATQQPAAAAVQPQFAPAPAPSAPLVPVSPQPSVAMQTQPPAPVNVGNPQDAIVPMLAPFVSSAPTLVSSASGDSFPAAASWGGVVRATPGMDGQSLDSLGEGEAVHIIENTGVTMNGYTWFKIQYRGNRVGYQWGGIICGRNEPIDGAFSTCTK